MCPGRRSRRRRPRRPLRPHRSESQPSLDRVAHVDTLALVVGQAFEQRREVRVLGVGLKPNGPAVVEVLEMPLVALERLANSIASPTRTLCCRPSSSISIRARSTTSISPTSGVRPAIGPPSCPPNTCTSLPACFSAPDRWAGDHRPLGKDGSQLRRSCDVANSSATVTDAGGRRQRIYAPRGARRAGTCCGRRDCRCCGAFRRLGRHGQVDRLDRFTRSARGRYADRRHDGRSRPAGR